MRPRTSSPAFTRLGPVYWLHNWGLDLERPTCTPVMAGDLVRVMGGPMGDEIEASYVVEAVGPDGAPVLGRNLLAGVL